MMNKAFEIFLFSLLFFLPTDLGMAETLFQGSVLLRTTLIMSNEIQF